MSELIKAQVDALELLHQSLKRYREEVQEVLSQVDDAVRTQVDNQNEQRQQSGGRSRFFDPYQQEKYAKQQDLIMEAAEKCERLGRLEEQLDTQIADASVYLQNKIDALKAYLEGSSTTTEAVSSEITTPREPARPTEINLDPPWGVFLNLALAVINPLSFSLGPLMVGLNHDGLYVGLPILGIDLGSLDVTIGPNLKFSVWRDDPVEPGLQVDFSTGETPSGRIAPISV